MKPMTLSAKTVRRFILGRQGLWPGRRWRGLEGTEQAIHACEAVQMDPLNYAARSHDQTLWGRVLDYQPQHLSESMYSHRSFFDYGGGLFIYPMRELPYWRAGAMRHIAENSARWKHYLHDQPELIAEVQEALRTRGPLGNRDFVGRTRVNSYRGRKDSALALYALWITGEVMIHHRQGFERVYDLRPRVAPPEWDWVAETEEAEAYFSHKALAFLGLASAVAWKNGLAGFLERSLGKEEGLRRLNEKLEAGEFYPVRAEGSKETWYALAEDRPLLEELENGQVPKAWTPLETTTEQEAVFLAPLDIVSARGRSKRLFDFEYIWEVYKPAHQRRWGYYTLPILWGDQLVGRLEPRLERKTNTLKIEGFWLEAPQTGQNGDFITALSAGLKRYAHFLGAQQVDLGALDPLPLRQEVSHSLTLES